MSGPYLNEPVELILTDQLSQALHSAQALAENADALNEQITAVTAYRLHNQLVAIERCIARAMGLTPIEPQL